MAYFTIILQIIAAIPELIKVYREIKKLVDDTQKEDAKVAVKAAVSDFMVKGDAKQLKADIASIRAEMTTGFPV